MEFCYGKNPLNIGVNPTKVAGWRVSILNFCYNILRMITEVCALLNALV